MAANAFATAFTKAHMLAAQTGDGGGAGKFDQARHLAIEIVSDNAEANAAGLLGLTRVTTIRSVPERRARIRLFRSVLLKLREASGGCPDFVAAVPENPTPDDLFHMILDLDRSGH